MDFCLFWHIWGLIKAYEADFLSIDIDFLRRLDWRAPFCLKKPEIQFCNFHVLAKFVCAAALSCDPAAPCRALLQRRQCAKGVAHSLNCNALPRLTTLICIRKNTKYDEICRKCEI